MLQTNSNTITCTSASTFNFLEGVSSLNELPLAFISVNKNRIKHYQGDSINTKKVYLKNGSNFQIELFNPTQFVFIAKLKINGTYESYNGIVIYPGQRIFLERFLEDDSKFIFNTYEVSDNDIEVKNAIKNNGVVEISFYKEKLYSTNYIYLNNITTTCGNDWLNHNANTSTPYLYKCTSFSTNNDTITTAYTNKIETGRVNKGEKSNQKFTSVNKEFESISTIRYTIHILPISQKNITNSDILAHKIYCSNCGKKVKLKDKFCSNCGHKL